MKCWFLLVNALIMYACVFAVSCDYVGCVFGLLHGVFMRSYIVGLCVLVHRVSICVYVGQRYTMLFYFVHFVCERKCSVVFMVLIRNCLISHRVWFNLSNLCHVAPTHLLISERLCITITRGSTVVRTTTCCAPLSGVVAACVVVAALYSYVLSLFMYLVYVCVCVVYVGEEITHGMRHFISQLYEDV